ncbi:MAG TPA: hypothetical protein G4N92_07720 [Anaerolineae bacterium]|nr:hypothetical protein [Anaerolineae bacterium]
MAESLLWFFYALVKLLLGEKTVLSSMVTSSVQTELFGSSAIYQGPTCENFIAGGIIGSGLDSAKYSTFSGIMDGFVTSIAVGIEIPFFVSSDWMICEISVRF